MTNEEIKRVKRSLGEYAPEALRSRKAFLELRLKQDPEIRKLLIAFADRIASRLKSAGLISVEDRLMAEIERQLRAGALQLEEDLTDRMQSFLKEAVEIGTRVNRAITIDQMTRKVHVPRVNAKGIERMYFRVHEEAVRASWERMEYGLRLSDRIWQKSEEARSAIRTLLHEAVGTGLDAVTTARLLEGYVNPSENIEVKYYQGLLDRAPNIPGDVSYPALRLARSETTAAFGRASIRSAQMTPSCIGIQFCLSPAHRIKDICDELATRDVGLGPGVYPLDDPPPYPAHPNTLSYLIEVQKSTRDFMSELEAWIADPAKHPELEDWYQREYLKAV